MNMEIKQNKPKKAFSNWRHNCVHLYFPNGNGISTIWGYCSYSDNHDFSHDTDGVDGFKTFMDSNTCEVMILEAPNKLIKKIHKKFDAENESVLAYLTMEDWLWIVKLLSK